MKQEELRTKNLTIRVSPEEYAGLQEEFRATTHRVFSDYIRDLIHQKPTTTWYRNKSLDEFLPTALALKNELQAIGRNVNQAVKKLNSQPPPAELKDIVDYFAAEEFSLRQKTEEIKNLLVKIYEQ